MQTLGPHPRPSESETLEATTNHVLSSPLETAQLISGLKEAQVFHISVDREFSKGQRDKKWIYQHGTLVKDTGKRAVCTGKRALPQELSGQQFYHQRKSGEEKKTTLFLFFCKDATGKWGRRGWSGPKYLVSAWDKLPREGPWFHAGKNSRVSYANVKESTLREMNILQVECGLSQKVRVASKYGVVGFYGLGNFIG